MNKYLSIVRKMVLMSAAEFSYIRKLHAKTKFENCKNIEFPLDDECYITSEKGIFKVENGRLINILKLWVFGIAINKDKAFISCAGGTSQSHSSILSFDARALKMEKMKLNMQELYRIPLASKRERIHQICCNGNSVWIANTARNTLTEINSEDGQVIKEIAPFRDAFGEPVLYDNNHINSVWHTGQTLLFVAYRAGEQSMIGVVGEEYIKGFAYKNRGAHDIAIRKNEVFFSDTFGNNRPGEGGFLIRNGFPYSEEYFKKPPGYVVRGIAGNENQLVIGHSHKGERSKRFKGNGSLILVQQGSIVAKADMPFSQVYDIIRIDGKKFNEAPSAKSFDEICSLLSKYLGDPVYSIKIDECILKPKKITK